MSEVILTQRRRKKNWQLRRFINELGRRLLALDAVY